LAEAQECAEAYDNALETIREALECNPAQLVHRPEALRIRGELQFKQAQPDLAQGDFNDAVELAQRMGAEALELRASMGLARVLVRQGRCDQACAMLAEIYGWFTEGFDVADLKEAKALLEELSGTQHGLLT
jgi:tetratricopeptide (TPR) repeat protein